MSGLSLVVILLGPVTVLAILRNRNDETACSNYGNINASIRMYWMAGSTLCDDNLSEGWYKLETEDGRPAKIPQLCIKNNFGGTRLPMHLDLGGQDLPDVNVTLEAHVCTSFSVLGKLDCCVLRQEAAVRNCGDFFVYYLKPVDRCPVAYVAQELDQNIQSQFTAKTGDEEAVQQRSTNTSGTSEQAVTTSEIRPTSSDVMSTTTTGSASATSTSLPDGNPSRPLACPSDRQRSLCFRGSNRWCYAGQSAMVECADGRGCGNMCDGFPDCADRSDESDDLRCVRPVCSEGTQRCPDGTQVCYTRCDGNQDCQDGFDEENCSPDGDTGESVTNSSEGTTAPNETTTTQISTGETVETTNSTSVSTPVFENPAASTAKQTNTTTPTAQPQASSIADFSSTTAEQTLNAENVSTSSISATTITSNVSANSENASSVGPEHTPLVHHQTTRQMANTYSSSSTTIGIDSQQTETSNSTNATVSDLSTTSLQETVEVTTLSKGNDTSTPRRTTDVNETSPTATLFQTTIQTSTTTEHIDTALSTGATSAQPTSADQETSSGSHISPPTQFSPRILITVPKISSTDTPSTTSSTVLTSTTISSQTPAHTSVATPTATTRVTTETVDVVSTQPPPTTTIRLLTTSRAASSPSTSRTPDIPSTSQTLRSTTIQTPLTVVTTTQSTTVSERQTTARSSNPSTTAPSPPGTTTKARTTTTLTPTVQTTTTSSTVSLTQPIPATQSTRPTHEPRSSSPTASTPVGVSKSSTFMGISASESTSNATSNTTESTLLVDDDSHGGLFGYNPGLFIFLIAAGIVIFCVTIFGIVGLVYYRRLRSWSPEMSFQDAYAEPEKTTPPPMREKNGIESPIPDVDILRGEEQDSPSKASTLVCGPTPDRLRTMNETNTSSPDTSGQNGFQTPPAKPAAVYAEIGTGHVNGGYFGGDGGDGDGVVPIDELDQLSPRIMFPWIESAEDTKL